jgi:hypothetical protein
VIDGLRGIHPGLEALADSVHVDLVQKLKRN